MPNNEGMRRQPTATKGGGRYKKTCRSLPLNSVGLAKRRKKKQTILIKSQYHVIIAKA